MKEYYVYVVASKRNGTLYTGVTNDIIRRVYEHKHKLIKGFTAKYSIDLLVYYEVTTEIDSATKREKQIKKMSRKWKLGLIEKK